MINGDRMDGAEYLIKAGDVFKVICFIEQKSNDIKGSHMMIIQWKIHNMGKPEVFDLKDLILYLKRDRKKNANISLDFLFFFSF